MAVTMQQIAERAGVSRGTVDRALNHRGRIDPEVEENICRIAKEMGYVQKKRKKKASRVTKLGILTQLAESPFMIEVNKGIDNARHELGERGVDVLLEEGLSVDEEEQLKAIDRLVDSGIQGLAIMPVNSERIREKINWLVSERGIPVVTFNSDISGTKRSCFVGMDNTKSGRTAAGLMGMLTNGSGKVLIITGFFTNNVNNYRVDGFVNEIKSSFPEIELAGVHASSDNADEVEKIIVSNILSNPGLNGLFVVSSGQSGINSAFEKLKIKNRPHTIIYDLTPSNKKALEDGIVDFLIDQDGYVQGYEPPFILFNLLEKGGPIEREFRYTDINIKTKYNL